MSSMVRGCHVIGSVPLSDAATVLRELFAGMPGRLKRVPDGETGFRNLFTFFQYPKLQALVPEMLVNFEMNREAGVRSFTDAEVEAGVEKLKAAGFETGYDSAAIESYQVFKELRQQGVVPPGVKFQVSVPSVASVVSPLVERAFQPKVYPIYEAALHRALQNIQAAIPHGELSIQLDLAADTAFIEGQYLTPWFENPKEYVAEYLLRMISHVEEGVEVGIHNCYGDMDHKHWFEPTSLQAVVDLGKKLFERSPHPINYYHVPVPVSTMDRLDEFLAPLAQLLPSFKLHHTEVYLGVVQYADLEGTRLRIEAGKKILPDFGVATECGWGRTPAEQLQDIMEISRKVSLPWPQG
jgi:hypothetical protein